MTTAIALRGGTLRLDVDRADLPLDELCGFASRRSRKRGFVFVSKVLGKHYPVQPARMADVYARLAAKLFALQGPVVLIGLAETATGLGQGIAEAWWRLTGRTDLLFLHTTRYRLRRPLALTFEESHSHATRHLLYHPVERDHDELFRSARTLVLVDDEISTGRTLVNLASAYRPLNRALGFVYLTCITDWLGPSRRREIADRIGLPTEICSLLQGSYSFEENASFDPGLIPDVQTSDDYKDAILPRNHGRFGVGALPRFDLDAMMQSAGVLPGERVLVLGTGEFAYPPFLLARTLEDRGHVVHFQSTTRSPLLVGEDIANVLEFGDNYHDGMTNFVYNVDKRHYERIIVCYETTPLPAYHRLAEKLDATAVHF